MTHFKRWSDRLPAAVRGRGQPNFRPTPKTAHGMLAERFGLSVTDAFELLRRAARNSRCHLTALAIEVTLTRATPAEVMAARAEA